MNPTREEALFELALEKPPEKRAAFLDAMCEGDATLRQRLEALLAAYEQSEGVLAESAPAAKATMKLELADVPDEAVGQKIGRYKILERVGEGGCGVVYVAEQTEPVRRRVALKVIKLGMDTKAVVARFEAERQALAMMDHPNIAKVLDAGTTEQGRPYFVMELVRGIRITDYCDQNQLSTKERLELFIKICQAIQHAHQKGIIHRDIKPSNILVTLHDGVPVPKVIDFGIAKATEGRLTDNTVYTQLHQFIGTPAYMSPEQAEMSGLDIDTRSDIYSLGVLLYELLAGSTPFDGQELMSQGIDAMRKTIREKEPVRPSTKLSQTLVAADVRRLKSQSSGTPSSEAEVRVSSRRLLQVNETIKALRGDLDWIVMRCLEKDRTRRYDTATGLAADIKRHLNNEPVVARPPSTAYRFQKAFRRNKLVFAAGTAIAAALLLGIIASTWQSVRATHAKREALSARQLAETSEKKAVAAQSSETKLREQADAARRQAEAAELAARQRAYASDMNVAKQALDENNLGHAQDLLNRQRPLPGQKDLRGWEWRYLWQQTRSDALFTLCQIPSETHSLAVAPDGLTLAIGADGEGGLSVWDLRTRRELFQLAKNEMAIQAAFSPTEPLLAFAGIGFSASGQEQHTLHLFNIATRRMIAEIPLDALCSKLVFAKDGRTLVTSTRLGQVSLWRMPDGTRLASYPSEQYGVSHALAFAVTRDLHRAAYGLKGGQIRVMDLRDGRELWTAVAAKQNNELIAALAFSPDGSILASGVGYSDPDIRLWDVATGAEIGRLEGHGSWVSSLVFWPDGKKLASSSGDQTIRIWDVARRQCLDVLRGHRQEVWQLALLPDEKTLISGCKDGTVCFWDTSVTHTHQRSLTIPAKHPADWNFASDGRSILTLDEQGRLSQWTGEGFQQQSTLAELPTNHFSDCFSADGRLLAVAWTNGILQVWDASQRILSRQFTNPPGRVWLQTFLAGGKRLITYSEGDNSLHEWDLTTGSEMQSWHSPVGSYSVTVVKPDEKSCVMVGWKNEDSVLRNLVNGSQKQLNLDAPETDAGIFSPNGKLFAIASSMGFARVWDTSTWKPVATPGSFLNGVHGVNFSPDGKRLAIASHDKEAVRLCDTESWQDVITLEGPFGFASTAFSPDGNSLVWASQNALVLWRAPSWAEIHAAEAKDPPLPGYGATGKTESQQP